MSNKRVQIIKNKASELGFFYCGISKAGFLEEEAPSLEKWLNQNHHGSMSWMENNFDKRLDPTKLFSGAKSVISLGLNYFQNSVQPENSFKVSKYAYGKDYHNVFKKKLKELVSFLQSEFYDINARAFVDSAPIMDKAWAKKSGMGWLGKNTNLISKNNGSFFFVGEIVIDLELEPDSGVKDFCGTCTKCLDACPTDALYEPYKIDGSKCISYLTIELKDRIPMEFKNRMDDWIFGCDICQDVCPWNRFSKVTSDPKFNQSKEWHKFTKSEWIEITEEVFIKSFEGTPLNRAKFSGLSKNIDFLIEEN